MDILKINDNSIKVMLSAEDMDKYALDCSTIEYDRAHSVSILREILRDAGDKCGFNSEGAKFFVQLYASVKGECEIYVRRLNEISSKYIPDYKWDTKELSVLPSVTQGGIFVYSFEAMTPMLQACSRLRTARYSGESNAYKDHNGFHYYLVLEERSPLPEEHGGRLCPKNTAYYINEHCKLICEGAVELLGRLI